MPKGELRLTKTTKGKIIVSLDRLNGKPPMPLSYVIFNNLDYNDKKCEYSTDSSGRIIQIIVDGVVVFGNNFSSSSPKASVETTGLQDVQHARADTTQHPVLSFNDSMNLSETKLPEAVKRLGDFDIDNFALKYQKAARCIQDASGKNKFFFFKNDYRTYRDGRQPTGHKFFIRANYGSLENNFQCIGIRQAAQATALFSRGGFQKLRFSPDWRLVCGLSGGIYETNMTLHHIYGVPYIPASSIKGVVRSWIITNVFTKNVPDEEKNFPLVNAEYRALKNSQLFCAMFGAPESIERVKFQDGEPLKMKEKDSSAIGKEHQGKVVFFDGLPTSHPELMPDVINVHYPDWYKEKDYKPPTDFQKTNPVIFLTVTSNSSFQTIVGCNDLSPISTWEGYEEIADFVNLDRDKSLSELAYQCLILALSQHGIGAKTAVGYGYMKSADGG